MPLLSRIGCGLTAVLVFAGLMVHAGEPTQSKLTQSKLTQSKPSGLRPAVSSPTERDIRHALQGKSDPARLKLFERLLRAGQHGDRAENIAALAEGLQRRIARKSFDAVDLKLLTLLANYPSTDAGDALFSFLSASDDRVALASLRGLVDSERVPSWERIQPLTQRPQYDKVYALRRAVVAAAEQSATPPAVEFLIQTVDHSDGQLKYEAARSLTRLTGQNFGGQADDWNEWWRTARDGFEPVPLHNRPSGSVTAQVPWDDPLPEFFNVPIYAKKVLFILDRSESMASSVDGELRIDRARKELEEAILKLPATTEFNVLAYHDFVDAFTPQLAPATPERKRAAILFTHRWLPELQTACYDALAVGLDDNPNLEAIYFLSDGEPTSGAIVDPAAIVEAITQQNRLKLVSIYTLGIDARGTHEEFLKQLAARNVGEYFLIR